MAGGAYADAKMVNVVEISGDKMKKMHTHLHIRKYKDIYICGYIQLFYGYIQLYTVIYIWMIYLYVPSLPDNTTPTRPSLAKRQDFSIGSGTPWPR